MLGAVLFLTSILSRLKLKSKQSGLHLGSHGYEHELEVAVKLAKEAGVYLEKTLHETNRITPKDSERADFVTASDQYIEAMLFDKLRASFPTHHFIGEESSASKGEIAPLTDAPTWIIDPIDGTTNFIHSNPMTCVSIGLVIDKVPVVGVVCAPCLGEIYVAVKGHGAFLNGKCLQVSEANRIQDSIIVHEFGYVRDEKGISRACHCLDKLLNRNPHALREYGSGVLDLAFLACGRVDAVYCGVAGNGWKPWDYAAGWLLVTEAGGVLSTLDGDEFHTYSRSMIGASTPHLLDEVRNVLVVE